MSGGKSNIVLCGFMASGKTTVGRILARVTGKEFVDTDEMVESGANKSIRDIFHEDGELYFRGLERDAVITVAGRDDQVVALGGGAVLDPENVRDLKRKGVVYLLGVSVEEAVRRAGEGYERPLLGAEAEDAAILMRSREAAYVAAADVVIETDDRDPDDLARRIAGDFASRAGEALEV